MVPYLPPSEIPPSEPPALARHFSPEQIGMDPQVFGMGRADWQTWTPSNVLIGQATQNLSPDVQGLVANRQLQRHSPTNDPLWPYFDGEYSSSDGSIHIRRMTRDGSYPSKQDETLLAQHEVLHAVHSEIPRFKWDYQRGLPELMKAIRESGWSIPPAIQNDPAHIFTGAAEAAISGNAPPALMTYFAPILGSTIP